jgi:hypothetical protein
MKRVFILGAGASAFCGYPLGLDFWRFVRDSEPGDTGSEETRAAVIATMHRILQDNPPEEYDRVDLEKLFTLLDFAHQGTGLLELRGTDWTQTKLQIMKMIFEAFLWHQYQFQAEVVAGRPRNTLHGQEPFGLSLDREFTLSALKNWTELLKAGDTIISFNWDILHESALWHAGKWHFADGYGFPARDAPKEVRSPIKVFKLHGSVNWAQKSDHDLAPEIEYKRDFFADAADDDQTFSKRIYGPNDGRYLIVPTYLKDLSSNRLLLRIWEQARAALVDAEQLVAVGFSLNEADAAARHLFASVLDRNAGIREVVVISPDPIEWDKLRYRFDKKCRTIVSKFEDWLRTPQVGRI